MTLTTANARLHLRARRAARPHRMAWMIEVAVVLFWNFAYESLRGETPTRVVAAFENARAVETFERNVGFNVELGMNQWFMQHLWFADFSSYWYQTAHETVTIAVLVWLWRRHQWAYRPLRTTIITVSAASLLAYRFYPLAPPRFALDGAVDTMLAHPVLFAGWKSITGLSNLYAAMPSIHVAWAVWVAIAVNVASTHRLRRLAWIYPAITTIAVIGTANHYVVDAVAGAAGMALGWQLWRRLHPEPM